MTGGGGVMVFRPTLEEFKDFVKYVEYMESQGAAEFGVAKIIPPEGWYACKDMQTKLKEQNIIIGSPVYQEISSTHVGIYQQLNIVQDSINLEAFKYMAQSEQHCAPEGTIEELEEKYWKSLTFNPPLYGADVMGSLYDTDVQDWNVDKLGDILDNVCEEMGVDIPGVNTPYLYFGMWKSTFAWHVEDMDLFSLNYLHFGEPKFWYAIPQKHAGRFETMVRGVYPESYKQCKEFIRHKMTVVSPKNLAKSGIPVNRMVQRAGEFMVTFPRGYHSGFNLGYNAAESANFALHRWVELGKKSKICYCFSDSVSINMNQFIQAYNECYGKNVAKVKHKNIRKTSKTLLRRKAISDKKKTAINRRRKHKNNMAKSTRVSKKKTAKKLLKMYALHSMDHDLELEPPDEFDVILDSEDDLDPEPAVPKSLATFLPKKHLSVRIHKTPQSPTKKPRSLMSKKNLRNVKNMLKYNCYKPDAPEVPCTKGQVDDTTISISEIFKAVEGEGGQEEIECELEEVPDIFSEEPVRETPFYTKPLEVALEAPVTAVETVLNEGTVLLVNCALNESVLDEVERAPQECLVEGPEMGGKVFCPTIGVDDPVIDVGPIRKAKRKRKRKPSFGSTGPRLNQKLVSSVGYIHCRYPRKEKANKANSIKKLKSEKLKPDTEAHPAVVKMRRVAWIFDHNYSHCKVKVYRLENDDSAGVSSEYDTRTESSTKAKTELTYYLPNCVWNRNILSLEHNLFVYRNFPKNKDIVKEKVYMFDDQPPVGSPYGKRNKQRKEKSPVATPEEFDLVESPPPQATSPPDELPALEIETEGRGSGVKRLPNSIPSYGQHKNYKLNPLHGNKHLPIDMASLSGLQREEYIQWVIKTGQRTADFRVWGHQDDDDGRIYKTKLSNELNQFKSSIEHNTLDPIVKAAFIKELTNMKFASHIQERPDIKPIIEQHDKRPYDQDNQESSEMLNKIKYVTPIYDPDDYRIGPRYQPEVPVPSTNGSSPDPRPRHMQYSSLTNKPLYKVSPFTHPPAPAMNPLKVKDNYAPVVEEEPIFTYSPPKHHPPGFKPNTVIPEEGTRVRAVNSLRLPTMDELYRQQRHPHFFQYPPVSASNAVFDGEEQPPQPSASYGTTKGMIYENWYPNTG